MDPEIISEVFLSVLKNKSFLWSDVWPILERQIIDVFWHSQTFESISSENKYSKWLKFLLSILSCIYKIKAQAHMNLLIIIRNMIFLVNFRNNFEKKCHVMAFWNFSLNASKKRIYLKLQKHLEKKPRKSWKSSKISIFLFIWLVLHFKNIDHRFKAFA
jgi:hypothetical protein